MSLLSFVRKVISGDNQEKDAENFEKILKEIKKEGLQSGSYYLTDKPNTLEVYKEQVLTLAPAEKLDFMVHCIRESYKWGKGRTSYFSADPECQLYHLRLNSLNHLLKTKLVLNENDFVKLGQAFLDHKDLHHSFLSLPINLYLNQLLKIKIEGKTSEELTQVLLRIKAEAVKDSNTYYDKDRVKIIDKIESILLHAENGEATIKPQKFQGNDLFSDYGNSIIQNLEKEDQSNFFKILAKAQLVSGGKPTAKFLNESKQLINGFGEKQFKNIVSDWFRFITRLKEKEQERVHTYSDGSTYNYVSFDFLAGPNIDALKGIVWMCLSVEDSEMIKILGALAERAYRKIPGKGPAAAALGNACLYVLSKTKGLEGIGQLSRLKLRIKQNSTQILIEKYLLEAAQEQGVSVHEIEDFAVDGFGLNNGRISYEIDSYRAELEIIGVGKTELKWFKPDGTPQKIVPATVKEKHPEHLKEIKSTAKQIEISLSAQRDRLDRQFKTNRIFTWDYFSRHYFSHGLMAFLTRNLIWRFKACDSIKDVFYLNQNWITSSDEIVEVNTAFTVELWHPAKATVAEIKAWRDFLLNHKILQPFKQAYREVYLLTDAEINTRTYSNRMAAHLLKQHQFNSLAKIRGWKYSLLGSFDNGREVEGALYPLPDFGLRAEFWVNEVNAEDAYNDTGIWLYVATDQVRFVNTQNDEVLPLIDIPAVIFSEIMRDVDLFVGVASVGNDPGWQDNGGLPFYRDYWQSYSFGDLGEVAKTRREILQSLIPRLRLAKVAEIKDKFLVVKGKLRTYKIHIGSTNILMEPNDQYLCIVPDRGKKNVAENVFLPFEGDNGLSLILSKAFLLADDDKITDSTIVSQINRK